MHLTQYLTRADAPFVKRQLFQSVRMNGASTLKLNGETLSDGFLGFGVAITGSSCYELSLMQPEEREKFLKDIYGKEGLGLSVGRISVGSSDYSPELYSYDDTDGDIALEHFSIDRDKAYIIPILQEILRINPDLYLFASPWSPPGWMKTGGSMCGGYMRREYIDCYADYIVRFLQEYRKCGINIRALTPQNEPETKQRDMMPACEWHPDIEAEFISLLRKKLIENRLDVKIWMYDYNFYGVPRVLWMLEHHPELLTDCNGIAFHYYTGAIEQTAEIRRQYPDMELHFTEGGPRLFDHYATDFCKWGIMMAKALNHGYSSFTGWNLMLDETGGPNIGPFFCAGLATRNSQSGTLSYSGQYQAFRHFSRFIQPGACILGVDLDRNTPGMSKYPQPDTATATAAAFRNPDGTLVFVLVNPDGENKKQVQISLGGSYWYVELLPDSISTVVVKN